MIPPADRIAVRVTVNGHERRAEVEVRRTLADLLRDDFELTGTHLGCEHGVCGACTVLVDGASARACLVLAPHADGCEVVTVEGLAGADTLSPLQQACWDRHSFQCGFCTPGFLVAATELLAEVPHPTEAEVRVALSGNICRCTGYDSIVAGVLEAAARLARGRAKPLPLGPPPAWRSGSAAKPTDRPHRNPSDGHLGSRSTGPNASPLPARTRRDVQARHDRADLVGDDAVGSPAEAGE